MDIKQLGKRIKKTDIDEFRERVLCQRSALIRSDEGKISKLITQERPLLTPKAIPRATKWLVVHGLYNMSGTAAAPSFMVTRQQAEICVEVSCFGAVSYTHLTLPTTPYV